MSTDQTKQDANRCACGHLLAGDHFPMTDQSGATRTVCCRCDCTATELPATT